MKTLFVTIALALATPALAWDNDLNNAIQTYEVDQQLNNAAAQARRDNQNTFNQGPVFHQGPTYSGCTPTMWAWCR